MPTEPENPTAAATHSNPYPYYTDLVSDKPLAYDEAAHTWIAASAEAVSAVLANDLCRVRPASEPVPSALAGSTAGEIFGALVRMTDGEAHAPLKRAISATLDALEPTLTFEVSTRHAQALANLIPNHLTDFAFKLPAYVVADLLGVDQSLLESISDWMADFVRCLSPISTPEQIEQGKQAADQLLNLFQHLLAEQQAADQSSLLTQLSQTLSQQGINEDKWIIANAVGFISQSYEATAGLIGNALVALAAHPELYHQINGDLTLIPAFVDELARFDSPVQNTRRFLADDSVVAGCPMKAGDAILVLFAAANRDQAANPKPDILDLHREQSRCFTFGAGVHACPGQSLAKTIVHAALHQILSSSLDVAALSQPVTNRPSTNTRVPLLNT